MKLDGDLNGALNKVLASLEDGPATRLYVLAAVNAKLNCPNAIEALLEQEADKVAAWQSIDAGVKAALGPKAVLTQHGFAQSLSALGDDRVVAIFNGINRLLECLNRRFGVSCYYTSGTLLGLVRSGRLIAHDDDIDTAYVSSEANIINVMLERNEIIRFINQLPNHRAEDHLPGLVHCYVPLEDGTPYRFDLFTGWVEHDHVAEYPLPRGVLQVDAVLPVQKSMYYGVEVSLPADPNRLLEVNYGPSWRTPDPTFRFDWKAAGAAYGRTLSGFRWTGIAKMRTWLDTECQSLPGVDALPPADTSIWRSESARAAAVGQPPEVLLLPTSESGLAVGAPKDLTYVDLSTHAETALCNGLLFVSGCCVRAGRADPWIDLLFGPTAPLPISARVRSRLPDGTLVLALKETS